MKVVITSIGKRVGLIKHLKKSFTVIGVDATEENVGKEFVDIFYKIPLCNSADYIDVLKNICVNENVKGLIPLYEGEFEILDRYRNEFKNIGTELILSDEEILKICKDKEKTYLWTVNENILSPKVYIDAEIEKIITYGDEEKLPLIIKPRDGMGSSNVFIANTIKELEFFKEYVKDSIVQQYIKGNEYTVDTLMDFQGNPIYIVPRKRDEVRSGEVSKSTVVIDHEIINLNRKVIESLNKQGRVIGPYTIQFIRSECGKLYLLEINPRFGGGVPLAFESGADYGNAMKKMLNGEAVEYTLNLNEVRMLRYDEAIYIL